MDESPLKSDNVAQLESEIARNKSHNNQLTSFGAQHLSDDQHTIEREEDITENGTQNGTHRLSTQKNSLAPDQQIFAITVRSSLKQTSKFDKPSTNRTSAAMRNVPFALA